MKSTSSGSFPGNCPACGALSSAMIFYFEEHSRIGQLSTFTSNGTNVADYYGVLEGGKWFALYVKTYCGLRLPSIPPFVTQAAKRSVLALAATAFVHLNRSTHVNKGKRGWNVRRIAGFGCTSKPRKTRHRTRSKVTMCL
jgi:hypothetical protein